MNIFNSVVIFGSNAVPWDCGKLFALDDVFYSHTLDGTQSVSKFGIIRRLISANI